MVTDPRLGSACWSKLVYSIPVGLWNRVGICIMERVGVLFSVGGGEGEWLYICA